MAARPSDFTPLIDLLAVPGTGPVRAQRPVYVDLMPPCNHACPVGEAIASARRESMSRTASSVLSSAAAVQLMAFARPQSSANEATIVGDLSMNVSGGPRILR